MRVMLGFFFFLITTNWNISDRYKMEGRHLVFYFAFFEFLKNEPNANMNNDD